MLINFCDPVLQPDITSSGACHDGYNVTNLISRDTSERQRGYLGYGSPPTTISIQFLSYVNIKHIVIDPQVRTKKSLGFEIFAKSISKFKPINVGAIEGDFEKIGFTLLGAEDNGVIFYKNNYKPKTTIEPNFLHISLFRQYAVGNTNCIKIRIFRALSSVPAIGRIEVWGEPGRSCSRSFKNHIYKLWHRNESRGSYQSNFAVARTIPISNAEMQVSQTMTKIGPYDPSYSDLGKLPLPEEFLDSITYNIMTLPFILPSGKVVDLQTLEKHKDYEAMYGRLPSDPFTGIRFSHESLPIPDHDLKRRIDRFLSENSHRTEFQNIPRTTGIKPRSTFDQTGILYGDLNMTAHKVDASPAFHFPLNNRAVKNTYSYQHVIGSLTVRGMAQSLMPSLIRSNQNVLNMPLGTQLKRKAQDTEKEHEVLNKKSKEMALTGPVISNLSPASMKKTHEQLLDDSLDSALKSALASLPSFVKFDASQKSEQKRTWCSQCKALEMLFMLPCKSLVCRNCLPEVIGDKDCANCNSVHRSCDVVRYHYQ